MNRTAISSPWTQLTLSILLFCWAPLACVAPPQELRQQKSAAESQGKWLGCDRSQTRSALVSLREVPGSTHYVAAHRGETSHAPGNSIAAIRSAVRQNIPLIEIDLRMNPEGKLFLFHDQKLSPGNSVVPLDWYGREIDTLSESDLTKIRLPGEVLENVAFFKDAAQSLTENRTSFFLIDLKVLRPQHAEAQRRMLEIASAVGAAGRLILQCQGLEELRFARSMHPELPLLARISSPSEIEPALIERPVIVQGDEDWMSPPVVEKVHAAGKPILLKSLGGGTDEPRGWRKLLEVGADILLTDKAVQMKQWGCPG